MSCVNASNPSRSRCDSINHLHAVELIHAVQKAVRHTVAQRCRVSRVSDQTMSRRARLRAQTSADIKTIALKLMAGGGPDAISLRAIAREMGMTAGAIYSYFATRDDLITALIGDVYTSAVQAAESARDAVPESDPGGRILA